MSWERKRVLVTGGASFIGSHLVDKLVRLGAKVRVADDLSSGRRGNLKGISDAIEFLKGDLRNQDFTQKVMRNIEIVFHLAASHGGRGYIDTHPAECSQNMVLDGIVFMHALKAGVEKVCFTSSACVYPTVLQKKAAQKRLMYLKEDMADPFLPGRAQADGEYGWAKLMGELVLKAYYKQYGLKSVSCRLFTVYGERENETHAIIALIAKALVRMDPYVIWGNGQQDRNFTYVGDIVDGVVRAAEKIDDASAINIGTSEHIKIIEVVKKIFSYTSFKPRRLVFDTTKPVGVFSRAADLAKARKVLRWEPRVSFDEGLRRTIRWYSSVADREELKRRLHVLVTER